MHQRQASSYGRRFLYGKNNQRLAVDLTRPEPGIGLVPAEFDDLQGAEDELVSRLAPSLGREVGRP